MNIRRPIELLETSATRVAYHSVRHWCSLRPGRLRLLPANTRVVSITFDDFPASAAEMGARLLEEHEGKGTYYACLSKCGAGRPFQPEHLIALDERGHELACHSYDHKNCLVSSKGTIESEVTRNAAMLWQTCNKRFAPHYAFPYGLFRPSARKVLGRHFLSLRTIHPGVHRGTVDLLALKSSPLLRDTPRQQILDQIREVEQSGGWLTFYTHEVEERPGPYGTTPSALAEVLAACRRAGIELATVGSVVARLGSEP
jgi:peptidoglycan/xylan/chitin deacetylase (PgdA/CDA1 family)